MIDPKELLSDLQRLLPKMEEDILDYSESHPDLAEHLKSQYEQARGAGRTAEHFVAWREAQITQAAVAWLLTCVFVRFLEDNQLLDEPLLAGPVEREDGSQPLQHAKERITAYFNENPTHAEREYLFSLFEQLERFPVIAELLDRTHNPLWQIPVSADGAKRLIDFFQRINPETGQLVHDFTDPFWDTRFLGDLYQDLSESVRKRYALLQTPEFVESFILDYTLEKAIDTFGLPEVRLIDPTCGSGHFLLTTFERVFAAWSKREPATNARALAQRALDVVHGVDINPYAVAICRFRLLIAAMKASQSTKIKNAPDFHFNLAAGDSLLHGKRHESHGQGLQLDSFDQGIKHAFESEDLLKLNRILGQRYHVVVGNPPYITVKDKALNHAYRSLYPTCHRQYSLGVPFTERFFDLTLPAEGNLPAGFIGMITANSFMKREFGKVLIESYLPRKDLTHIIDTSGAYIPGHGTPTVILFARNRSPGTTLIRSILGTRGEPKAPNSPSNGLVWRAIVELLERPGERNPYINSIDINRKFYSVHPWSLSGGGAAELKKHIEHCSSYVLGDRCVDIGRTSHTGEDDVFCLPASAVERCGLKEFSAPLVEGEQVRDWGISRGLSCLLPYQEFSPAFTANADNKLIRYLWSYRAAIKGRRDFGQSLEDRGINWYEHSMFFPKRLRNDVAIAFAEVATHNHFVLNTARRVFKQTAPAIYLLNDCVEDDYLEVSAILNSSIMCFWMKQTFHNKGDSTDSLGARVTGDPAFDTYQYSATALKKAPLVRDSGGLCAELARDISQLLVTVDVDDAMRSRGNDSRLSDDEPSRERCLELCVGLQEELDWHCYGLFGVASANLVYETKPPRVAPGERAFEIALARQMLRGEVESDWFKRHGIAAVTDIPVRWPPGYRALVEQRLEAIENNKRLNLLERPEFKRRWSKQLSSRADSGVYKEWLLGEIEHEVEQARGLITIGQLSDRLQSNHSFLEVGASYLGNELFEVQFLASELVSTGEVPQMAPARLKPSAIKKFRAWQEIWEKQRREDAIDLEFGVAEPLSKEDAEDAEKRAAYERAKRQAEAKKAREVGRIPVPPKYSKADFHKGSYWTLRGKLDVPKERFFSLPGCGKSGDATLVIGWAGMNHLQRAQAIAAWYIERKNSDGWDGEKLMPMLVALDELIPWLKQWHNDLDPEYGQRMGDFYEGFLLEELRTLGIAQSQLKNWQPPAVSRTRRKEATA